MRQPEPRLLIVGWRAVQKAREIYLQRTGQVPQGGDGGAAFTAFDLADHGPRHARKFGHRIKAQALSGARGLQAGGKLRQYSVWIIRHAG